MVATIPRRDMSEPRNATGIRFVRGDITEQEVDAIVNAANSTLLGGGGVDGAVHRKGGPAILEECRALRRSDLRDGLPVGMAVSTTAGRLPARRVIHTVGPVWQGGSHDEPELLARAYSSSLDIARAEGLRSIAFPSISTGAYGYPVGDAAHIAITAVRDWIDRNPGVVPEIRFVLFSDGDLQTYRARASEGPAETEEPAG